MAQHCAACKTKLTFPTPAHFDEGYKDHLCSPCYEVVESERRAEREAERSERPAKRIIDVKSGMPSAHR